MPLRQIITRQNVQINNFLSWGLRQLQTWRQSWKSYTSQSYLHTTLLKFNLKYLVFNKMRSHNQRFSIWTFTNSANVVEKSSNINMYFIQLNDFCDVCAQVFVVAGMHLSKIDVSFASLSDFPLQVGHPHNIFKF